MKKIFTSVAIFLMSLTAMAQTPSTINYQGVCSAKNSEVAVTFVLMNGETEVYSEVQNLKTNASGMFAAKIGNAEGWDAIDWAAGGLSLKTLVDGATVSVCELSAVPYAKFAEHYEGQEYIENDVQALVEGMRGKANISDLEAVENLAQSLSEDIYKEGGLAEIIEGNMGAIDNVTSDVQGIQESLRGKADVADLNDFKASVENAMENVQFMGEFVMGEDEGSVVSQLASLDDAVANVSSDVQGIQETLRGKANVDDVAAIENLAQSLSEDIYKEGGLAEIIEGNMDALADVTSDVQGIQESLRGKANVDDVAAIENLAQSLSEDIYKEGGLAEIIEGNMDALANVTSDVQGIQESLRGKANVAAVEANADAIEMVSSDVQGIQEKMRSVATVAALEEVKTDVEDVRLNVISLSKFQQTFDETYMSPISEAVASKADATDVAAIENLAQSLSEDIYKEGGLAEIIEAQAKEIEKLQRTIGTLINILIDSDELQNVDWSDLFGEDIDPLRK